MQQFPNNQSFYNDPTQYQPYAPPPPPGQKPLPHERLIRWFKARNKFAQVGIGCLSLLVICTMCGIFNTIAQTTNTPQDAPTTPAKVATHAVATATEVKPTATPRPTPTTAPAPA